MPNRHVSEVDLQIGAGAFGVVHRAVAVGIREREDQVIALMMIIWILSDGGRSQVCEAICRKRSAKGELW